MRKLVLLSLDAMFRPDLALYPQGSWMRDWLDHAALCTQVKTVFPALTYPAHTTLITGCDPAEHGIGQNQPFQPDTPADMRRWYWEASLVQRESLFGAVKRQGGQCANLLWPVTGKSRDIRRNFPEVVALPGENQVLKMLRYGSAAWVLYMEALYGKTRPSTHEPHLSDYAVRLTKECIRRYQPELTCAHLVDVDEMRHHHGTNSPEAQAAIARMEDRVRGVWELMQRTKGMEDALLAVVSDHGQADVDRPVALEERLSDMGMGGLCRVQSNGMSAFLFLTEAGRAQKERLIRGLTESQDALGISHVYQAEELSRIGCVSGVELAVEAAPGVVFEDGLPQAKREKATHGFGPGHPAEDCLFAVRGRSILEGVTLPSMPMRDVAPTLAGLMGIDLPQATGTDHSGEIRRE